jgi:23S rRNA (pseudouridine1915-N3)-methyltransferase
MKSLSEESTKDKEGELILAKVNATELILLDENTNFSSVGFSEELQKENELRHQDVLWGGPYGFSDMVYSKAQGKISLSLMTFSSNGALILLSNCIRL